MDKALYLLPKLDLSEYKLGIIIPLTVEEVIHLEKVKIKVNDGEEITKYHEFLLPFILDENSINISKMFDYSYFNEGQNQCILAGLVESLKILYKTSDFKLDVDKENKLFISISDAVVNQSNYKLLCDIVKEMFFISNKEEEKKVIQVAEENRAILEEYLRLQKQHEEEMAELNKKNQKNLHQMITIVASDCLWDYDKVLSMTYYRFINTYVSIFKIDNFKTYMQYATSGQFDMKNQKQEHWMDIVGK